jgi:hypothetical protein
VVLWGRNLGALQSGSTLSGVPLPCATAGVRALLVWSNLELGLDVDPLRHSSAFVGLCCPLWNDEESLKGTSVCTPGSLAQNSSRYINVRPHSEALSLHESIVKGHASYHGRIGEGPSMNPDAT